jgi:carboxymethylenebutenolidase
MYDAMTAETITIHGDGGDAIPAYLARPLGAGPFPGVVVVHHMPGWDSATKEITRRFASKGYSAICPNLHHREGPGLSPGEAAQAVRDAGGVPDARCVGDVQASADVLRELNNANGKVGVIGYCSGGRQAYLVACSIELDAAVSCYGGGVIMPPERLSERTPVAPIDLTAKLSCPLLGLFGVEDQQPSPEQVARTAEELERHAKDFEFHSFENAGHAFFSVDRPNYRVEAAQEGWAKIWDFFGRHLSST